MSYVRGMKKINHLLGSAVLVAHCVGVAVSVPAFAMNVRGGLSLMVGALAIGQTHEYRTPFRTRVVGRGGFSQAFMAMDAESSLPSSELGSYLDSVENLDLERYMGKWYEIAKIPMSYEPEMIDPVAEYSLSEGKIRFENTGYLKASPSKKIKLTGTSESVDPIHHSKLSVQLSPEGRSPAGKYWIFEVGADYEYAVVGTPERTRFRILSRTPDLDRELYEDILSRFGVWGFDTSKVVQNIQREATDL